MRIKHYTLLVFFTFFADVSFSSEVRIAVASNFKPTLEKLSNAYTQSKLSISSASTGKLTSQISRGAPFDIFLSAGEVGTTLAPSFVVDDSEFTYAIGQLVLVTHEQNAKFEFDSPRELDCIAYANPAVAPYGRAAAEVIGHLEKVGVRIHKHVKGQSVAQAQQFFLSKACNWALIAQSQITITNKAHTHWLVPAKLYQPIRQNAVLLKRAHDNQHALQFFNYLNSDEAKHIIVEAGYLTEAQ
ncbi:hypothetical protein A3715_30000 [Oleiphilus sp. HI0009]|nr:MULTISPECIES: molybdate ABC transporter substrate-binding protein [unclassified Oleiphilus]KZX76436.1 hypothetical protein A3715_13110 [Oleiphilus sp. HI0009]KZX84424.1 hypothetical protein A3715_30000 [Oleiphilus sp. HI0009]KZY65694.1 hypothetical protein A3738_08195 [Oleiphilus sp. HI0066]KZY70564.1 hypothetical protein A3739_06570 [Oleiphilus sp. HI0067]